MGADSDSSDASDSNVNDGVTVNICGPNVSKFSVKTSLESTVGAFKVVVAQSCDLPAQDQRLIYNGQTLDDEQTLESFGLEADHTVHMVRGLPTNTTTTGAANLGSTNTTPGLEADHTVHMVRGLPTNTTTTGAANLGSTNTTPVEGVSNVNRRPRGRGGVFRGVPEFDEVQQQLSQNPNMMREIMSMPAIRNLMNNPELVRNLIMSNPQMRAIIDRNSELAHILNDPTTLRQAVEASRNPQLMREMMQNTDRAMSNVESSPEGFNMLRRMSQTVQEPFLNATIMTGGGDNGNDLGSNPLARDRFNSSTAGSETAGSPAAPNANPLPNPWSSATSAQTRAQTNTTTRPNPVVDAPGISSSGLEGEMERMLGGLQDSSQLNQMMQSLLSNPQYMSQLDSNSQLREMMQNPEFLPQVTSPERMQQVLALQQSLLSNLGQSQSAQEPPGQADGTPNNIGLESLMNMFRELGTGGLPISNASNNVEPEQIYATQLSQLQEMGFFDTQENIRALSATAGNVQAAVQRLLGNNTPDHSQ